MNPKIPNVNYYKLNYAFFPKYVYVSSHLVIGDQYLKSLAVT